MTNEEKKARQHAYYKKWYDARKNDFKTKTREYAKKYYAEHREELLARQRERYANFTPEERARHSKAVMRAEKRRKAVQRADTAQKQLAAKAQSVAAELNRLFEQWDR